MAVPLLKVPNPTLHGCLKTSTNYDEDKAWTPAQQDQQTAA
jgi:hypothetical protein